MWLVMESAHRAAIVRRTDDPVRALRDTVEGSWRAVERASRRDGGAPRGTRALLVRRELVRRETWALSAVIRRGIDSGAFWPQCPRWAVERLPFAIIAGACAHWVFGLARGPSLRVSTAVAAALEILRPLPKAPEAAGMRERKADR